MKAALPKPEDDLPVNLLDISAGEKGNPWVLGFGGEPNMNETSGVLLPVETPEREAEKGRNCF
jgi:hypothetical protein